MARDESARAELMAVQRREIGKHTNEADTVGNEAPATATLATSVAATTEPTPNDACRDLFA